MLEINFSRHFVLVLILLSSGLIAACGGSDDSDVGIAAMTSTRERHAATLLPNGNVLVSGGRGSSTLTEIYDPSLGTWSPAGEMAQTRFGHTSVVLSSGLLLVVGGDQMMYPAWGAPWAMPIDSAELFDSSTNAWSSAGIMTYKHGVGHTGTLLQDGKVLIAGGDIEDVAGSTTERSIVAFSELYDPSTGTWSLTGDMTEPRKNHNATLMNDGSVLVSSGNSSEIYDPSTGVWSKAGEMPNDHGIGSSATLLNDGKVLIAGGGERNVDGSPMAVSHVDIYDPGTGQWSSASNMATAELDHTATLLVDGKLLIVGPSSAQTYDPDTDTWALVGDMSENRGSTHAATLLKDNTVLITGGSRVERTRYGIETSREVTASAEIYDPAKGW